MVKKSSQKKIYRDGPIELRQSNIDPKQWILSLFLKDSEEVWVRILNQSQVEALATVCVGQVLEKKN